MKLSVLKSLLLGFFFVLLIQISVTTPAFAIDEFRTFRTGEFDLQAALQYFQAGSNYDNGGKSLSLPSGDSFSITDGTLGARWVLYPRIGFLVSTDFASAQSKDAIKTRNDSGITAINAGFDYLITSNKTYALWPEFNFKYPFHRVDYASDTVLTDEGAMEATVRMVGRMRLGSFDSFAYAGYRYRDEGRSGLVPFGVGAEIPVSRIKLGGEFSGVQTVVNDSGTKNLYARDFVANRDGSSLYFDSINPAKLDVNAWMKWNGDPFQIKFGGGTTLAGANTAGGWWAFVAIDYQLLTVWDRNAPRNSLPAPTPGTAPTAAPLPGGQPYQNNRFQDQLDDGVDQNLFVPPPPPPVKAAPRSAPMLEESAAPVVKPKNPTKKERAQMKRDQQKKMQGDLDQTQMQIELKSRKDRGSGN